MSIRRVIEPNESGQYNVDEDEIDRANQEIKNVKDLMSKLSDQLANIEKGIAVKRKRGDIDKSVVDMNKNDQRKREDVDKLVGFDMNKNEMHVIPVNRDKLVDLSATEYAPINEKKAYGQSPYGSGRGVSNQNLQTNGSRSWSRNGNRHISRNDNWNNRNQNNSKFYRKNDVSTKLGPVPYSPRSPLLSRTKNQPENVRKKSDGWGNNKQSDWGKNKNENGDGWSTPKKGSELITDAGKKNIAVVSIADTIESPDNGGKMKDDLFRILKYRNYTFETTPLKQMYMDCFNKQCIDVAHIGSLLPKLIMFPETKKIANEKVEAAAGAFEKT